jgi:hypothetical protein
MEEVSLVIYITTEPTQAAALRTVVEGALDSLLELNGGVVQEIAMFWPEHISGLRSKPNRLDGFSGAWTRRLV